MIGGGLVIDQPVPPPVSTWTWLITQAAAAAPVFQVVGAIATTLAAIAAWRSASAARFTARRADETSRRAVEALGRATRPYFEVLLSGGDEESREPQPARLYVYNHSEHSGVILGGTVRPTGSAEVQILGRGTQVGTTRGQPTVDNRAYLELSAPLARVYPDIQEDDPGPGYPDERPVVIHLDYSDALGMVHWRERVDLEEKPSFQEVGGPRHPVRYSYGPGRRYDPEILNLNAQPERPVGWIRRTWRKVW